MSEEVFFVEDKETGEPIGVTTVPAKPNGAVVWLVGALLGVPALLIVIIAITLLVKLLLWAVSL